VDLILGHNWLQTLTIATKITGTFILVLDILRAYDMKTNLKHHMLRMGEEEVSLLCTGDRPRSFFLTMVSDEVISPSCERSNCTAGGFTGGDEQPSGTQLEYLTPRVTLHSQDVGSSYFMRCTCHNHAF
jgi:hypothetical protein